MHVEMIAEIRRKSQMAFTNTHNMLWIRSILRHITVEELRDAIASGQIIEDHPDDKYGP
jgi:hypothetical protein